MENGTENKKDNKNLIIMIIILSLLVVGLGGYLVYDKVLSKNTDSKDKNQGNEEEQSLSLDNPTVQKLYGYVNYGKGDCINYNDYFLQNKSLTVASFDNKQKFYYAWNLLNFNEIKITPGGDTNPTFEIPNATYDKAIKELFGENITYSKDGEHTFISNKPIDDSSGVTFKYVQSSNSYVGSAGGVGGTCPPPSSVYYKLTEATKTNDEITLKEKFIFTSTNYENLSNDEIVNQGKEPKMSYKIFADYNRSILIYDSGWLEQSAVDADTININQYIDKANTITYRFKLGNDNEYHFVSSEIEK